MSTSKPRRIVTELVHSDCLISIYSIIKATSADLYGLDTYRERDGERKGNHSQSRVRLISRPHELKSIRLLEL